MKIAINGFGRMGRLVLRALWNRPDLHVVHVNDPALNAESAAHLLTFDSVHGRWHHDAAAVNSHLVADNRQMAFSSNTRIEDTDWAAAGVDLVLECSGKFRTTAALEPYFQSEVPRVLVAAPVPDALNLVYGVNHHLYDPTKHRLLTAASCTTNCIAPVVKVVHEQLGIRRGSVTTIHDVTNTQVVVDAPHKDLRRARSALNNLIPTSTGSATAITMIYPELKGRLNGIAVRVPLLNASIADCVFELETATTADTLRDLFEAAAADSLQGILGIERRPLVSSDFLNDPRSAIVDGPSLMVVDNTHVKILAWYDNEWGYVNRMADLCQHLRKENR